MGKRVHGNMVTQGSGVDPPKQGVVPNARVFTSGLRDLAHPCIRGAGDPSLRLKSASVQDDAALYPLLWNNMWNTLNKW